MTSRPAGHPLARAPGRTPPRSTRTRVRAACRGGRPRRPASARMPEPLLRRPPVTERIWPASTAAAAIDEPDRAAGGGTHDLRRQAIDVDRAVEHLGEALRFAGAADEEDHAAGRVDQRRREGEAGGVELRHVVGDRESRRVSWTAGVPGKSDAVWPSSPIPSRIRSNTGAAVAAFKTARIVSACTLRRLLGRQTHGVGHGWTLRRRHRDLVEEGALGLAGVALGARQRHPTLVAPKKMAIGPVDPFAVRRLRQQNPHLLWASIRPRARSWPTPCMVRASSMAQINASADSRARAAPSSTTRTTPRGP